MNNEHVEAICSHFDLGRLIRPPIRVYGGLLHTMWRLDTNNASYAIKQLSKKIVLTDACIRENYERSECVASRFIVQGIPAVCAIEKSGRSLIIIEGTGFLIYPWVEAKALDQHAVSEKHAIKIAEILAKMHGINLNEPEMTQPEFYVSTHQQLLALIDKADYFKCPFVCHLRSNQKNLLAANDAYQNAIPILKTEVVVSHGDLDQKNVLWDHNHHPILIDWESVCKINPTYDIVNTAFYWSGITKNFNKALFFKIIGAYQQSGGLINKDHVIPACDGVFSWIGWMVYNIERSCVDTESESKTLGIDQVNQTIDTILRLQKVIPELIKTIMC